jgi:hypothetical protein
MAVIARPLDEHDPGHPGRIGVDEDQHGGRPGLPAPLREPGPAARVVVQAGGVTDEDRQDHVRRCRQRGRPVGQALRGRGEAHRQATVS